MNLKSLLAIIGLFAACFLATPQKAHAQYRNTAIGFSAGWLGLSSLDGINKTYGDVWGASDQLALGVTFRRAVGYNLFFENQTNLGLGGAQNTGATARTVPSLSNSTGLHYNFLDERHRPYVAGFIEFLFLFPPDDVTNIVGNAALGGQPLWVGIRPEIGYEYFIIDEQSIQFDVSPTVFINLDQAPKFGAHAKLSWNVYF